MLPVKTFEMRTPVLTNSLENPSKNAEEILHFYQMFVYEDIHYIMLLINFVKICENSDDLGWVRNKFLISFCYYYQYIYIAHIVEKNTRLKLYLQL